ncbi:hypothetical protein [Pectobacterium versatile]|uniref:hypothetical protein n=1 Tax=Pectobacterium versatile TaxID=2488639 RepID=UPI0032EC45D3
MKNEILDKVISKLMTSVQSDFIDIFDKSSSSSSDNKEKVYKIMYTFSLDGYDKINLLDDNDKFSKEDLKSLRLLFIERYSRMIDEFIGIESRFSLMDDTFKDEIIDEIVEYIKDSDYSLYRTIINIRDRIEIKQLSLVKERSIEDIRSNLRNTKLSLTIDSLKKNVELTSSQCSQRFQDLETSTKGLIKLKNNNNGRDFTFFGSEVIDVLPCFIPEPRNDFEIIGDIFRLFSGESRPERDVFTAIKIGGRYNELIFVNVLFDIAYKKIHNAIDISKKISSRKFGDFS